MSAVARRYAKALFALAKDGGALQPAAVEIDRLAALAEDPTVGPVLRSPLLTPTRRHELSATVARELDLSDLLRRFLSLLANHHRLGDLPGIRDHFQSLLDAELGRVRITIRSAAALTPRQENDLITIFSTLTGRQVIPTVVTDPDLLGGVLVEADGKVYDGTVRTQLARLAKQLTGTASL